MIVTENLTINDKEFVKTYSDSGFMVERDGIHYSEAIDPAELGREYTESSERIDGYTEEATAEDYQAALAELGVEV
jgi:hypothetical protein